MASGESRHLLSTSCPQPPHIHSHLPEEHGTIDKPYAVSAQEREWYYYGVTPDGDQPHLLYRTSSKDDPWIPSSSIDKSNLPTKHAYPANNTKLGKAWPTLGRQIADLVRSKVKKSYSINVARFMNVPPGEDSEKGVLGPAVIWIGVDPKLNMTSDDAHEVSQSILAVLAEHDIEDAQVEWNESVVVSL
ncbi:hypothetical protein Agabi119p4_7848 [Agaricus bisporus var. burnettii]|uniref:Uncharacterized protein n=1 Tax=Agaricus bisporus var. burnettii TaxID=192524 RepID=A0A8H7EZW3_AGABI|nr:hypothetical protein Agabi119p4_7848 [Agaricus bisporus var. burnettii]